MRHAVGADPAAVHALGVERHGDVALGVEGDDAAGAAGVGEGAVDRLVGGLGEAQAEVVEAGADVAGDVEADEVLALAGAGGGAAFVGPGAGADDG